LILVDTNVLMYAAGAPHPHKEASVAFMDQVAAGEVEGVLDAEVLQEILHRYRAINRWEDGRQVYDLVRTIFPVVLPVTAEILDRARDLLDAHADLWARDALHAAVALHHDLEGIASYDRDLDEVPGLRRLEP